MKVIKEIKSCTDCDFFNHTGSFSTGGAKPCCNHQNIIKEKGNNCFKRVIPHTTVIENNKKYWDIINIPNWCPLIQKIKENNKKEVVR